MNDQTPESTSEFGPMHVLGAAAAITLAAVAVKKTVRRVRTWNAARKSTVAQTTTE